MITEIYKNTSLENIKGEIWKNIYNHEGYYQVSNFGRIKGLERLTVRNGFRTLLLKEKIIKPMVSWDGYLYVGLYLDGKYKRTRIHRVVAQTFIINPDNKPEVNHKNGIKHDNRVENLEWNTKSENEKHAYDIGLKKAPKAMFGRFGKLNGASKPIYQLDKTTGGILKEYDSARTAMRETGIHFSSISSSLLTNNYSAGGFKWKYKSELPRI